MKTLVLTVRYPARASYYDDWRDAFAEARGFDTETVNIFTRSGRRFVQRRVDDYELIVLLHVCTADSLRFVEPLTGALQHRRGRLVSFVGNEVNLPWAPLGAKLDWLRRVQPDFIATQLLPEAGEWLYQGLGARVIGMPHALNPSAFQAVTLQSDRKVDIGTRSYRYLAYLGDDDRNRIYDYFSQQRFEPPLVLDFSTDDRLDRTGWSRFLDRCKATISTEAGSWYLERDDATVTAIRRHMEAQSGNLTIAADSPLKRAVQWLPYPVKEGLRRLLKVGPVRHEAVAAENINFDDIHAQFFANRERCAVYSKCISSRHFDAIGTKTVQIMFPGRFNDILRADEHYISLNSDFSNIDEVLARFRDVTFRRELTDRTHEYVMAEHTYARRLETLLDLVG